MTSVTARVDFDTVQRGLHTSSMRPFLKGFMSRLLTMAFRRFRPVASNHRLLRLTNSGLLSWAVQST